MLGAHDLKNHIQSWQSASWKWVMVLWRSSHRAKRTDISISPAWFLNKNTSADADRSRELQLHQEITPALTGGTEKQRNTPKASPCPQTSPAPSQIHPLQGSSPPAVSQNSPQREHGRVQDTHKQYSPLLPKHFIQISGLKPSQNNFVIKPVKVLLQYNHGRVRQSFTPNTAPMGFSHPQSSCLAAVSF